VWALLAAPRSGGASAAPTIDVFNCHRNTQTGQDTVSINFHHRFLHEKARCKGGFCNVEGKIMRLLRLSALSVFLLTIAISLVSSAPVFSANDNASQNRKTFKLLILDSQEGSPYEEIYASVLTTLASHGYTEGKNLKTIIRYSGNSIKRGEHILDGEQKNSYDVILVIGTPATLSAKNVLYGKKQRVVFSSVTDPVGIGVIKDFISKPAGNFTGVSYPVPVKTRLKFLKRLMPKAKIFGLVYADMPQSHSYNMWLESVLKNDPEFRGIKIIFRQVPLITGENGDKQMAAISKKYIREIDSKVDAYIKSCDQLGSRRFFSETVYNMSRKPLIGLVKDDVMGKWGATATIYPSHDSIGDQSAKMIMKLFEGETVSQVMPEWPHRFGIAVDLRKAKQFRLEVPIEMLQMAGENIVR
jgi:putative ABC transport system substrate-binding protein